MKYFKHRGVEGLVYARVLKDDNETDGGYVTGEVKPLAPVARIGKTVEASSATEFYDNIAMFVINSEEPLINIRSIAFQSNRNFPNLSKLELGLKK